MNKELIKQAFQLGYWAGLEKLSGDVSDDSVKPGLEIVQKVSENEAPATSSASNSTKSDMPLVTDNSTVSVKKKLRKRRRWWRRLVGRPNNNAKQLLWMSALMNSGYNVPEALLNSMLISTDSPMAPVMFMANSRRRKQRFTPYEH